jgi:hypothetical protein
MIEHDLMEEQKSLGLAELQALCIVAATDLGLAWLDSLPGAREYVKNGFGVAVEVKLFPAPPRLSLSFIDEDGTRYPHAVRELK